MYIYIYLYIFIYIYIYIYYIYIYIYILRLISPQISDVLLVSERERPFRRVICPFEKAWLEGV